eukprot:SAG22_NODE_8655_length_639_cov_0.853704_1_plen_74_part_00
MHVCYLPGALLGPAFTERLAADRLKLDGRLSLRYYPPGSGWALGPHVDGNLLTVLWADGPGLQVGVSVHACRP